MKPTLLASTIIALLYTAGASLPVEAAPATTTATPDSNATSTDDSSSDIADGSAPGKRPDTPETLKEVVVTSVPFGQTGDQIVTPVSVLAGSALDDARAGTIGQTVSGVPGVQTTAFGNGVGRPVIRGLDGSRVAILSDGMGSADVSNVSQDHATTIEPFLADQIEILKGPSTLLYGSGAIGGVVNAVDGRIPERAPDNGFSGRAQLDYDSVSEGGTGLFRIDAGGDGYALHADGMDRHQGNYDIPGGTLANSFVHTKAGAFGGSILGDWGFLGLSISRYLNDYGNPAEPGDAAEGEPAVRIGMEQTRYELKGGFNNPLAGIERADVSFGHSDYQHIEFEGDEAGTTFTNRANEGRIQLTHAPLGGWMGAFGVQFFNRDFAAIGEESFVPPTTSKGIGLFVTEQKEFGPLKVELGARSDRQSSEPIDDTKRDFHPLSLSAGLGWHLDDQWHLSLNLDRAQRAPAEEELFANGPHAASATFEVGDRNLEVETANQAEIGLHYHTDFVEAKVATYYNRYNDFIYLADTGLVQDDFPVRNWTQADARFRGYEAEATFHLGSGSNGHYDLRIWGDSVRATLVDGGNLPRIPSGRVGSEFLWKNDDWRARLGVVRYLKQDKVADFETDTAGFTGVTAGVDWTFYSTERTQVEAFVNASNLTNQTQRLATSLIKDQAPLPGRNFTVGLRAYF